MNVPRHESPGDPLDRAQREAEWVQGVRAGDERAFAAVFGAYYDGLMAFVGRFVGEVEQAEEVVQDVFFAVWEHRQTFALKGSPRAYLYSAARNRALMKARRGRLERAWSAEVALEGPPLAEPADHAARRHDGAALIAQAVHGLSPKLRMVFELSRGHGLTTQEIAHVLGASPKSVEQQLWRALAKLRTRLAPLLPLVLAVVRLRLMR